MNKKQLKAFFGHKFGKTAESHPKYIECEGYTIIPNKNYGLCDILPHNSTSEKILSQYRGYDTRLLISFFKEELERYVEDSEPDSVEAKVV